MENNSIEVLNNINSKPEIFKNKDQKLEVRIGDGNYGIRFDLSYIFGKCFKNSYYIIWCFSIILLSIFICVKQGSFIPTFPFEWLKLININDVSNVLDSGVALLIILPLNPILILFCVGFSELENLNMKGYIKCLITLILFNIYVLLAYLLSCYYWIDWVCSQETMTFWMPIQTILFIAVYGFISSIPFIGCYNLIKNWEKYLFLFH